MHRITLKHWFLLGFLVVFWGTSFLQIALSLQSFSPEQIVVWRLILASIILLVFLFINGKTLPMEWYDWWLFSVFAIMGNVLPYWLITTGQQSVTSGLAGLLMAIMPLITIVLAHWFVPNERLTRNRFVGFVLGISGVLFVLWPNLWSGTNSLFGALIILAAACCYAINTILVRRFSNHGSLIVSTGVMITAAVFSVIFWPSVWEVDWSSVSAISVMALVWLGIVPTGIASVVFFVLVKQAGPSFVANNNYVIPVVAYIAGAIVLAEPVSWWDMVALMVILGGIKISRYN